MVSYLSCILNVIKKYPDVKIDMIYLPTLLDINDILCHFYSWN